MTALTPEQLNSEFLRHFMPETLYLIETDQQHVVGAPEIADVPSPEVVEEATPAPTPPSAPVPSIPKLPKVETTPLPESFDVIGDNRKGLIVLVTLSEPAFKDLPQSQFLTRILAAIGFGPADVAFVNNVSGATTKFEILLEEMQTNYIISFASRLDTDLPHEKFTLYNPVSIDGVPVLFSQSLAKLDGDQNEKMKLWEALKKMFGK